MMVNKVEKKTKKKKKKKTHTSTTLTTTTTKSRLLVRYLGSFLAGIYLPIVFDFIFSGDKDNDDDLLHSGSHYFPFEFTLPPKLPSSFKGKHGRLRYYVRLTICTPGGPNHERTSKFAVVSTLDLNKEPDALVGIFAMREFVAFSLIL